LARPFEQCRQNQERLLLQIEPLAAFLEFPRAHVQLELTKADSFLRLSSLGHRAPNPAEWRQSSTLLQNCKKRVPPECIETTTLAAHHLRFLIVSPTRH
jgi:hypothetical protein